MRKAFDGSFSRYRLMAQVEWYVQKLEIQDNAASYICDPT